MSNVTKFLLMAFGIGITCLLILYFKMVADTGIKTTDTAKGKLDEFNMALSESDITMYDGYDVAGSDVVSFIKKNLGGYETDDTAPISVCVTTRLSTNTYRNNEYLADMQNFASVMFIKPVAEFTCSVVRDANDVITGVNFTQK